MKNKSQRTIRCGVIGYGGAFNMGNLHLTSMSKNPGVEVAAICELDPARRAVAEKDWPGAKTYGRVNDLLRHAELDLVTIITPHNTHAPLAVQCLEAGVNAICEKPMAITSTEVKAMMAAARRGKVMLSTFHNRRWDGDFVLLRDLIQKEAWIGRVFRIEAGFSGYGPQGNWWRADRKISGGAIYDWGAHFTDWILNLVTDPVDWVSGYQVKNPEWSRYSNEDHSEYTLRFKGGAVATLSISNLAMSPRPRWRILGEQGSIEDVGGKFLVKSLVKGRQASTEVAFPKSDWDAYYQNVLNHLRGKEKLVITAQSAARVIGVLEAANLSAAKGSQPVKPAFV
ncbi:MAG: Gfo/Idh/MocA family oxidoreductase [Candidatus Latescibacteria bacterium]|nr:Gfo/Idh/MocA family oxidoreductase [Candidatus Latescibacterota bacterium]